MLFQQIEQDGMKRGGFMNLSPYTAQGLVEAARGEAPLDLLLRNARLLDMATGEIRLTDIGVWGGRIAGVYAPGARADANLSVELDGAYVAPGLIDTHVHLESSHFVPEVYANIVVRQGTTSVLWDPHELANVCGIEGVRAALRASRGLPLRVLLAAPSCVPAAPGLECSGAEFSQAELEEMLSWPEVASVGELMNMGGILANQEPMAGILKAGRASGKVLDGHARNLSGLALQGYVAAGIHTDHELVSGEDALEKLRAGLTLQIRGSHDYLLPEIAETLLRLPHLGSNITLCTDDIPPDLLLAQGGLLNTARRMTACGLPAVTALRMATLNAALLLGLRDRGLIAPGRLADMIILEDLSTLTLRTVYSGGIAMPHEENLSGANAPIPGLPRGPLPLPRFTPGDFRLRVPGLDNGRARLRTIKTPRFTRWSEMTLPVREGAAVVPEGQPRMAVIHRHGRHGRGENVVRLALLEDWGEFSGAIASTYTHDSHNLVIIGGNETDMAAAANRLVELGGGMAVAKNGAVLAEVAMPVAGILSDAPPRAFAEAFARVRAVSGEVAEWKPPYRVFKAIEGISLACNAGPHLTDLGLTDGTTREIVEPVLEIWRE